MDPSHQIDTIKIGNFNRKLQNELEYFKNSNQTNIFANIHDENLEERTQIIEYLLNIPIKKQDNVQQQKENMFKEIDKYTFRKQWNKLLAFHKIVKIKEYIKENIKDESMQNEIIEKLTNYANEGRVNTRKYVTYDPNSEKILSMPCLIVDVDKKTYQLKII
jgi:hypothetical protein